MPNSPSIGRPGSTQPLADTHTPSTPAADSSKPPAGAPHAGPAADGKLGALASNSANAAAGKGGRASFAAKVSSVATNAASKASTAAQAAQAGAANLAGRTGRMGAFSQGAATVANGMTGMATAGISVLGGVMQMEQAAVMQVAETMKQGARNVEEASKG